MIQMIARMLIRYGLVAFIAVLMVYITQQVIVEFREVSPDPGVTALLGTAFGALAMGLTTALKDLYGPNGPEPKSD
tara:strand:+ start:1952 stop:2179 length:228 start_codon:yes stop_codon:yes gene_type:complete